ncbi:MAG: hypothetical protein ABF409_00845 [Bifidobacterium sp.]|uniref:Uncharacterized protein n=1 Tax=Bifidobacterium fermentum TaxID=3059035 RepID=A0AB39UJ63_9BIFI
MVLAIDSVFQTVMAAMHNDSSLHTMQAITVQTFTMQAITMQAITMQAITMQIES